MLGTGDTIVCERIGRPVSHYSWRIAGMPSFKLILRDFKVATTIALVLG